MAKEIRKERDFWGREKEVIYEGGEKRGEIRNEKTFSGTHVKREYDTSGERVSETRHERTWSGRAVNRTYSPSGERINETRHEHTFIGAPVDRTYDNDKNLLSETRFERTFFGTPIKRVYEVPAESARQKQTATSSSASQYENASSRSTKTNTGIGPVIAGWLTGFLFLEIGGQVIVFLLRPILGENPPQAIGALLFFALWASAIFFGVSVTKRLRSLR